MVICEELKHHMPDPMEVKQIIIRESAHFGHLVSIVLHNGKIVNVGAIGNNNHEYKIVSPLVFRIRKATSTLGRVSCMNWTLISNQSEEELKSILTQLSDYTKRFQRLLMAPVTSSLTYYWLSENWSNKILGVNAACFDPTGPLVVSKFSCDCHEVAHAILHANRWDQVNALPLFREGTADLLFSAFGYGDKISTISKEDLIKLSHDQFSEVKGAYSKAAQVSGFLLWKLGPLRFRNFYHSVKTLGEFERNLEKTLGFTVHQLAYQASHFQLSRITT